MAAGGSLPSTMRGTGLLADIAGFSYLADQLTRGLGQSAGAEELTRQINCCYDALIAAVHRARGSVVGFAGDAILCWFDGDPGWRAAHSGLAMQEALRALAEPRIALEQGPRLSLKIAVARGAVRRLQIGDEAVQLLDTLAGGLLSELAEAEHHARPGEVVVSAALAELLSPHATLADTASGMRLAVLQSLSASAPILPDAQGWPPLSALAVPEEQLRPWLLPEVYRRLKAGQSGFLADLRPATALFVRFTCLDYDQNADAVAQLDGYVRWVQRAAHRLEGTLLQLTLGDKGSYLYVAFGGPIAHEDDTDRALRLALELQRPPPELAWAGPMQVGISRGWMRAGAYGAMVRRTYGIQSDEVNLAARLMQAAGPSEILASARVYEHARQRFQWTCYGTLQLKGKAEPVPAYRLLGRRELLAGPELEAASSPLHGRSAELAQLHERLELLRTQGRGGVVIIEGEPGMGKSRLSAALRAQARARAVRVLASGADPAEAAPYQACASLFRQLLQLESGSAATLDEQQGQLLGQLAPGELALAPLFNAVLPIGLAETPETLPLAGPLRAARTRQYLAAVVTQRALAAPLLLLLEDAHWLDSASLSLLLELSRQAEFLLVVTTRPVDQTSPVPAEYWRLRRSPDTQVLRLSALEEPALRQLIEERLGARPVPEPLVEFIWAKAQGNPFFSAELACSLRDCGVLRVDGGGARLAPGTDLNRIRVPDTVQGVIVSRIDRLPPPHQLTLKLGSAIGRSFSVGLLRDIHPIVEEQPLLRQHLALLAQLELVLPGAAEGSSAEEAAFVFKHALTQEAAYHLMLSEQRSQVHRSIGEWYERHAGDDRAPLYALLAHHFGRAAEALAPSDLLDKAIFYNQHAGEQAAARHANLEATRFFGQALSLLARLPETRARKERELRLLLARTTPLIFVSGMYLAAVGENHERARALCKELGAQREYFWVLYSLFGYANTRGEHLRALALADELLALAQAAQAAPLLAVAHYAKGFALLALAQFARAQESIQQALAHYQPGSLEGISSDPGMQGRGFLAFDQIILGYPEEAAATLEEGLALARKLQNPFHIGFLSMHQIFGQILLEDFAGALARLQSLRRLAQDGQLQALFLILWGLEGLCVALTGEPTDLATVGAQLAERMAAGLHLVEPWLLALLGRAYLKAGLPTEALRVIEQGLALVHAGRGVWGESPLYHAQGEALLALGREEAGEAQLFQALELARKQHARLFALNAAVALARRRQAQGRGHEGRQLLAPQLACFGEGHRIPLLQQAAQLLSSL